MKRCCALLLVMVMVTAMFAACTNDGNPETKPPETQESETAPPDFSGADFTGTWGVSQVLDSLGAPVSQDKLKAIGADYTIELLDGGLYIICDAQGKVIGQGNYSVVQDRLVFSAGGGETVYTISDENTIQCEASDGSVTIMTRRCNDTEEPDTEEPDTEEPDMEEPDAEEPDAEQETQ